MNAIDATMLNLKDINQHIRSEVNGKPVHVENAVHLHGLAAGLKLGEILVHGDVGDYVGALNAGARILVTGNAGKYAGDNMTGGELVIQGSAGYGVAQYCYGGTLVVHGDAGDFTATMNKGADVLIQGSVGDEAGTYMLKGNLVIVGDGGENFANYLIRGSVFIGGKWKSLGHNTKIDPMTEEDINLLRSLFNKYNIQADPTGFKKIVAASEKPFYK
jgi:methylamine---glutamate N-methyltransferase subunit B